MLMCSDYAATRLYNSLGGANYRSYGCALLSQDSRRRRLPGVELWATCVYNYLCNMTAGLCRGVISEVTQPLLSL